MKIEVRTRLWAVRIYKHAGWAGGALVVASVPASSPGLAGGSCIAIIAWGITCCLPGISDRIKIWAKGTRAVRTDLFRTIRKKQPKEFHLCSRIEQAVLARANPAIQRRMWWDASAVMWMLSNPGNEHQWRGMLSAPGWFDDSVAWRDEMILMLEQAADEGWICPNAKTAWLLERPEMSESKKELGQESAIFAQMGDPWPSRVRFCDTMSSMGHSLYNKGFGESLVWRSHGALERIKLREGVYMSEPKTQSKGGLRL